MQRILAEMASTASKDLMDFVTTTDTAHLIFCYVFSDQYRFIHTHCRTNLENMFSILVGNDFQYALRSY